MDMSDMTTSMAMATSTSTGTMSMTMSMASSTATSSMSGMSNMSGMSDSSMTMYMSEMIMTFFTSFKTPLFSEDWTPTSKGQYAGTCIFLIVLAVILRLLIAIRPVLEGRLWTDGLQHATIDGKPDTQTKHMSGVQLSMQELGNRWSRWRVNPAAGRATYEMVVAGVAYLLMIAVMTMNLGYFLSVLGGIWLGTFIMGSVAAQTLCERLFQNTSRRWIFNENDRLRERYVKFQPTELQQIAGEAVQQDYCHNFAKLAEGGFNKVFLLRAKNEREVIARIRTPITGPAHYTTASEVATMDFLRTVLKLPVREVLAYSKSSENPVGAEYILMERVEGESLSSRWLSLTTDEVKDIMTQIADMERKILDFYFPAYGSLYYKKDLDGEFQIPVVEDFCIGPVFSSRAPNLLLCWREAPTRPRLIIVTGHSPEDCVTSAARREMAVIQHHAKAQPRQTFLLPTTYDIHPSEHTSLLSQFLRLVPHLIPSGFYSAPTLRHPDLSLSNIFLAPGSTKIISIIDWQDAVIFPRFMQAGYPAFCEHDSSQPQSLQIPSLPDDFDTMGIDQQRQSRAVFRLEEANLYYTAATGVHNDKHMDMLKLPHLGMRQYLLRQTGYPWDADVINLRAALVGITTPSVWSSISSAVCPVIFSNEERESAMAESQEWNESEQLLSRVREHLDIDPEGGTESDNFERAVEGNWQIRMEMIRQAEVGQREISWRNWPYKDEDDNSMPPLGEV
ncbi:Mitochondria protein Fmp29 [Penicillium sp. IBT 18751x]|nr:Mitochondria protein Fmp29 [Penicillium sp. IBT 18751x]